MTISKKVRIPLAKKGKWYHDEWGLVEFTDKDFTDIVSNHKQDVLGFEPYATYGHLNNDESKKPSVKSTDAELKKGELEEFIIDKDILYGDFTVNEETYNLINNKEYEYASGEFYRNFLDKNTNDRRGTAFIRVALTNAPFLPMKEKIQILSQNVEASDLIPFSMEIETSNVNISDMKKVEDIKDSNKVEDVASEAIETNPVIEVVENSTIPKTDIENNTNSVTSIEEITNEELDKVKDKVNIEEPTVVEPTSSVVVEKEVVKPPLDSLNVKVEHPVATKTVPLEVSNSVPEVTTSEPTVVVPEVITESASAAPTPEEKVEVDTNKDNKQEIKMDNLELTNLINDVNSLKAGYQTNIENYETKIKALTEELSTVKQSLASQGEITQAFSTNMSKANEAALYNKLAQEGLTPVVIQKFSILKGALEEANVSKSVIKLSTNSGTESKNVDLIEAIAELLLEASGTEKIQYQQFGITTKQNNTIYSGLQQITQRNKELSKKVPV